ncbi:MAG: hypothetical protein PHI40_07510, partial [Caldisericia bacterium]|nr:hypothetical protein [Caldisericia bacterium]
GHDGRAKHRRRRPGGLCHRVEGDLRFKYVQDDSMGCTIDKREIYYVQDNIYYHHSAQEGWMRIDEKSASLHKIQPPTEYLTSMIVNEPPDEVTSFTKDEIDSSHALFRYWKCKEFETVIQCDWKQKEPLQWLLFFTADNHLIGGLFENFSPGSKKVSTMLFERINEEFSFHLDTIVEP